MSTPKPTAGASAAVASPVSSASTTTIRVGSMVVLQSGHRADAKDRGVIYEKSGDDFSVVWASDGQNTKHKAGELELYKSPKPAPAKSTATTRSPQSIKHRELIHASVPSDLKCPLHSQNIADIQSAITCDATKLIWCIIAVFRTP